MVGGKHKPHAHLHHTLRNGGGAELNIHPQRLHHVRTTAFAAHAAPAVFADLGPRRSGHKHGTGGNIESVRAVSAGAHNVHQMSGVGHLHLERKLPHHHGRGRNFAYGFFFDAQAGDKSRHHQRRHLAAHDEPHDVQHFVMKNFAVLDHALQRFLRGDLMNLGHTFRWV